MSAGLIERIQAGDAEAWQELVNRYADALYRYVYFRIGMRKEEAEDLLQKTLLTAVEKMGGFKGDEEGWYRWCCGIAKHHLQHFFRAHSRRHAREIVMNEIEQELAEWLEQEGSEEGQWPEARMEKEQMGNNVSAALSCLPSHYQHVLLAKYDSERSMDEIAGELRVSTKAVESMLIRARAAFKLALVRLEQGEAA